MLNTTKDSPCPWVPAPDPVHCDVICDGCDNIIVGSRYKCGYVTTHAPNTHQQRREVPKQTHSDNQKLDGPLFLPFLPPLSPSAFSLPRFPLFLPFLLLSLFPFFSHMFSTCESLYMLSTSNYNWMIHSSIPLFFFPLSLPPIFFETWVVNNRKPTFPKYAKLLHGTGLDSGPRGN